MLGDILSMDVYRSYPIVRTSASVARMSSVACGNGLVASHGIRYIPCTSGGTISSLLISGYWFNDTSESQLSSVKCKGLFVRSQIPYSWYHIDATVD